MNLSFDGEYDAIPELTQHNLLGYIHLGQPGGHFLNAVLSNNLKDAVTNADDGNSKVLALIVKWIYNRAPGNCWGSPKHVSDWVATMGLSGA